MWRRNIPRFLFIMILPWFAINCTGVRELVETFLQRPVVTLQEVSLQEASLMEATAVFRLNISNPNPIGLKVDRIVYNLTFNDKEFVKGTLDQGLQIVPSGSEVVDLPLTVNYLELFSSIRAFMEAESIDYHLFGSVAAGPLSVPYGKKGSFRVPKVPAVSMKQVRLSDVSLTGASLVFSLDVSNQNPFAVALSGLDYHIKLGGTAFAQGVAGQGVSLSEEGKTTVDIPLQVSFLKLGQSAYNLLTQKSSAYEVSGEMKIALPGLGTRAFPFKKSGEVPIGR